MTIHELDQALLKQCKAQFSNFDGKATWTMKAKAMVLAEYFNPVSEQAGKTKNIKRDIYSACVNGNPIPDFLEIGANPDGSPLGEEAVCLSLAFQTYFQILFDSFLQPKDFDSIFEDMWQNHHS